MPELFPFERFTRETIVRMEADTNPEYGKSPDERTVEELLNSGIVIIDKPAGPTSHQVSAYVKDILGIPKAGHSGTLDPNVTGCLPVTVGGATKGVQLLLKAGKEYIALMHIHKDIDESNIRGVIEEFLGKIEQMPPVRSSVRRRLRTRSVYYFQIIEIEGREVLFKVGCEAGTYIRKLIHDMGMRLGTGAHMVDLRRTRVGPLGEDRLVTLQDLTDAMHYYRTAKNERFIRHCIKPLETALAHIPKIWIQDSAVDSICHGAQLNNPGIVKLESGIVKDDLVAVFTLKGEIVSYGFALADTAGMVKDKGQAVKTEKVFMAPGTYPKMEKIA
jgi:H/ACA ribonucleoprotein complex subunit 4